jgi:coatomer subunit zeta
MLLYSIKGILILNNSGQRIIARYYDDHFPSIKEQKEFEKVLFSKTSKSSISADQVDIIMIDGLSIVFKSKIDLFFYVIGSTSENEIILMSVLNCLFDSINEILRKNMEKKVLLENLDFGMLVVDEICDNGIILEIDASQIVQRVCFKQEDSIPYSEQTVVDLFKSLLK